MSKPGDVLYADGHAWKIREAFNGDLVAEPCTHGACKRIEALSELPDFTWLVRGGHIVSSTAGVVHNVGLPTVEQAKKERLAYMEGRAAERVAVTEWLRAKVQPAEFSYAQDIERGEHVKGT